MSEQVEVQVREGVWRTRDGREVAVRARDFGNGESSSFCWCSKSTGEYETWLDNGRNTLSKFPQSLDLIEYLRPLPETEPTPEPEPQPEPEPKPVDVCAGIWKTRGGEQVEVRARRDRVETQFQWIGRLFGVTHVWRHDGRWAGDRNHHCDLVEYVGPLPQQTTTDTLAEIEAQTDGPAEPDGETWKALAIRHEAACQMMQAQRDQLQQQLETMTAERDEVANELRAMTDHCSRQREQLESLSASRDQLAILLSNAQCAHDMTQRQVQQLQAELQQARIDLEAERQVPRSDIAISDAAFAGFNKGKAWAFREVCDWLRPFVGANPEDAAALLDAVPGLVKRLAQCEGVEI